MIANVGHENDDKQKPSKMPMNLKQNRKLVVAAGIILVALAIGSGTLYCEDHYQEDVRGRNNIGEAKVVFYMGSSINYVHEETLFTDLTRPQETHCSVAIYAFNSAYTSYRVKRMAITVDGKSALNLINPSNGDFDNIDMWFRPDSGRNLCNGEFPGRTPRIGSFALDPHVSTAPLLTCSPTLNSRFHVELDLDILSTNQIVASGTTQSDFVVRRRKRWTPWLEQCLWRAIMPNF